MARRCSGTTKTGRKCFGWCQPNSDFCHLHQKPIKVEVTSQQINEQKEDED